MGFVRTYENNFNFEKKLKVNFEIEEIVGVNLKKLIKLPFKKNKCQNYTINLLKIY